MSTFDPVPGEKSAKVVSVKQEPEVIGTSERFCTVVTPSVTTTPLTDTELYPLGLADTVYVPVLIPANKKKPLAFVVAESVPALTITPLTAVLPAVTVPCSVPVGVPEDPKTTAADAGESVLIGVSAVPGQLFFARMK